VAATAILFNGPHCWVTGVEPLWDIWRNQSHTEF